MMKDDIERFLKHASLRFAAATCRRKKYHLSSLQKYLKSKKLEYTEATQPDIERYLLSLDCTDEHRQAVCYTIKEFYIFIKFAHNPAAAILCKPKTSRKLFHVPPPQDIEEALARLRADSSFTGLRNSLIVELAYGSGLRSIEMSRLNIEDINLTDATIFVLGKQSSPRVVPLTASAVETLRRYLRCRNTARGPLLVSLRGNRFIPSYVYEVLWDTVRLRPHQLRHACATHMLRNGCSIRVIQTLLGHKKLATTQIYTEVLKDDLAAVLKRYHPRSERE